MKHTITIVCLTLGLIVTSSLCQNEFVKSISPKVSLSNQDWWETATFYQIYPRSFKDSDNDGSGDLQGIIQKLDYLSDLGIQAIWLSPIFKSPQVDNGYDISDYRAIDELYGTLEDLKALKDAAHSRNIKLILDYVPNHTSDQHEWFKASVNGTAPYDDFYVWLNATYDGEERRPPNNWRSAFGGSAWEWNEQRQQYYLHQFAAAQPDLNYRNPQVLEQMKEVLVYWLEFGIDGFRMDAVTNLVEDDSFQDEPVSADDPTKLDNIYTMNQPLTFDIIYQFRELLDEYSAVHNSTNSRIMMTEAYADVDTTMKYYVNENRTRFGAHFSFNFISFITGLKQGFDAFDLALSIAKWEGHIPAGCVSNWVLGNHDQSRVTTRLGPENSDALNIIAAMLPGVHVTYQGEEIAQENGEVTCEEGYDPQAIKNCTTFNQTSRDFERTPFQWNNLTNAGFNEGNKTWLPVSAKYPQTNVAAQNTSSNYTPLNIYKRALQLRNEFRNTTEDTTRLGAAFINVFYLERTTDDAVYALLFNVASQDDALVDSIFDNRPMEVLLTSGNSQYAIGDLFIESVPLRPREAVLLKGARQNK